MKTAISILRSFLERHNADEREWDAIDKLEKLAVPASAIEVLSLMIEKESNDLAHICKLHEFLENQSAMHIASRSKALLDLINDSLKGIAQQP